MITKHILQTDGLLMNQRYGFSVSIRRTKRTIFRYTLMKRLQEGGRMLNLEEQFDRIFKYLYFHLHDKHMAEDMTQEAFLRFLGSRTYRDENRQLQYLYTIARNLCSQYYRDKTISYNLDEEADTPRSRR